jgi:dsRNA-specific ribonuclease
VDTKIHKHIRHDTTNSETIRKYEEFVESEDYIDFDELDQYFVKMLADVIESIIGAILLDSHNIEVTEKAWLKLCEPYLIKYADKPKSPPKRRFTKF